MEYNEDDYLMLSGIQHFVFCRRQWALIHIEQQWAENYRTVDGSIMHSNAHDGSFNEKRGDLIITRAMPISSRELGISGECDVVEFRKCADGVPIVGREGRYSVTPVEYKRGEPKNGNCDILQLTAQAVCLEDMLCCSIPEGFLYYGENRRRLRVEFTQELRSELKRILQEMHSLYARRYTPEVKRTRSCNACSLKDICLPTLGGRRKVSEYISSVLNGGVET